MIELNNLTKVYRLNKKQMKEEKTREQLRKAVNNLSFTAAPGEIYGLLGPNGAGKTTALRCIATLLTPTEGTIAVAGYDTKAAPDEVRRRIGFLTTDIKLDQHFTTDYLFHFLGRLHGVETAQLQQRREQLFSYFGILDFADKKIEELSTGMKQKAAIAVSLVHDPDIIIFDEPTSGLDIVTARSVTDYLLDMKKAGKTVLVSTHIMSEAEKLCDRIGVMIDGRKVAEGTLKEILTMTDGQKDLEDAFFWLYQKEMGAI